jgi:hypothetical protein
MHQVVPGLDRYCVFTILSFAFVKFTRASEKPAWELSSKLWFETICDLAVQDRDLKIVEFAKKTLETAKVPTFDGEAILRQAWDDVGIRCP